MLKLLAIWFRGVAKDAATGKGGRMLRRMAARPVFTGTPRTSHPENCDPRDITSGRVGSGGAMDRETRWLAWLRGGDISRTALPVRARGGV